MSIGVSHLKMKFQVSVNPRKDTINIFTDSNSGVSVCQPSLKDHV